MSKHTPGPWKYAKGKYGYQIWQDVKKGFGNHWIANLKCESCPADDLSNARLISAAPELLEALEALAGRCDVIATEDGSNIDTQAARAAIAKAKGESA